MNPNETNWHFITNHGLVLSYIYNKSKILDEMIEETPIIYEGDIESFFKNQSEEAKNELVTNVNIVLIKLAKKGHNIVFADQSEETEENLKKSFDQAINELFRHINSALKDLTANVISTKVNITERTTHKIIKDLENAGYLQASKGIVTNNPLLKKYIPKSRNNTYVVHKEDLTLRHPNKDHISISTFLEALSLDESDYQRHSNY